MQYVVHVSASTSGHVKGTSAQNIAAPRTDLEMIRHRAGFTCNRLEAEGQQHSHVRAEASVVIMASVTID